MTAFLLMLAGLWFIATVFLLDTRGLFYTFWFKFIPFILGLACLAQAWQLYMTAA